MLSKVIEEVEGFEEGIKRIFLIIFQFFFIFISNEIFNTGERYRFSSNNFYLHLFIKYFIFYLYLFTFIY